MRRVYVVRGVLPHIMRRVIFGTTPTFTKHVPLVSHFGLASGTTHVCWLLFFVPSGMRSIKEYQCFEIVENHIMSLRMMTVLYTSSITNRWNITASTVTSGIIIICRKVDANTHCVTGHHHRHERWESLRKKVSPPKTKNPTYPKHAVIIDLPAHTNLKNQLLPNPEGTHAKHTIWSRMLLWFIWCAAMWIILCSRRNICTYALLRCLPWWCSTNLLVAFYVDI